MAKLIIKEKDCSLIGLKSLVGGITLLTCLLAAWLIMSRLSVQNTNIDTPEKPPSQEQSSLSEEHAPDHPDEFSDTDAGDNTTHLDSLLLQVLRSVQSVSFNPEDRITTQAMIKELASTSAGRILIADAFYDVSQAGTGGIMYNLILDTDLKDNQLITALVEREPMESSPDVRQRLIDLISDLSTNNALSYSNEINDFLIRAAIDPAPEISHAARIRHAWYTARFSEAPVSVLADYLLDSSSEVRLEVYEILKSLKFRRDNTLDPELVLALQSLLKADYLLVSPAEQASIRSLLATSTDSAL